ncbi:alpha/beta fold hydrolase [Acinetobacter sp. ANC 4635]|uniref:alpha/beta fold hydrolase n=1 Tax=Acinetobacter sp. ANC 4635 TaxID=2529846 RepID=UPI00103BE17B|nr:alpha/beta hydrolase [Acinetobacter sp. ANC 4635]TCB32152.1 alpha/beta fold hydrolase [Acinetobacter sp. ANC 4635]
MDTKILFLPGASGSTQFWQPVQKDLAKDYQTTIIGYPGFGQTPANADIHNFQQLTEYVLDQIQQPCYLVAQSMGGIFAIAAALRKPELIRGLVLLATSGGIDLTAFKVADWRKTYREEYLNLPDWFITAQSNHQDQLHLIHCPTLLLWGGSDPISPVAIGQYLQQQLKQSDLNIIAQGQHDFGKTHALEVTQLIRNFLTRHKKASI